MRSFREKLPSYPMIFDIVHGLTNSPLIFTYVLVDFGKLLDRKKPSCFFLKLENGSISHPIILAVRKGPGPDLRCVTSFIEKLRESPL